MAALTHLGPEFIAMEHIHHHGNLLHMRNVGVEALFTLARYAAELTTVFVGCMLRIARCFEHARCLNARKRDEILIADLLQEHIGTHTRFIGAAQVAEARRPWHAAQPDDERVLAPLRVVGIGIRAVFVHQVKPIERVDVARMHAEEHTRLKIDREIGDLVLLCIEAHEHFF
ncbi:unknown [Eggerthella sp. CAG:298]|nr:unknown [Eggerthella sp. CAG:298]